jgi:hypothetical protein
VTKHSAKKLEAGRYAYRTYVIEEVSWDAGRGRPLWLISLDGEKPCDAAESLKRAKELIDGWFDAEWARAEARASARQAETGKPLIEVL